MLHKTKGIVLRTVKYGETSLIVSVYTELFGIQSYLLNGVRNLSKKGGNKASFFQPASILEMIVYHNELKHLQRMKEYKWSYLYEQVLFDVKKNAIALFMIELLQKTLKQPEQNSDLFHFIEDAFIHLDSADEEVAANFALFFTLHLTSFLGFRIEDDYSDRNYILDLKEGVFTGSPPPYLHFIEGQQAYVTSQLLKTMQPQELREVKLNHQFRRQLLQAYMQFYALHIADFGSMKTLPVLTEVLC